MNETIVGILLIGIFACFAGLMYAGKLPALIALPLMAAALFLVGGLFFYHISFSVPGSNILFLAKEFVRVVFEEGMPRLWNYCVTVILGAILAELLKESGISKTIIRWASELGGDNKLVMTMLLTLATAALFTSLVGLGSVIMVAGIVLPILVGIGIQPAIAGSIFLFAMSLGGAFNLVNLKFYMEILAKAGMNPAEANSKILSFVIPYAIIFLLVIVVFIALNVKKSKSSFWAIPSKKSKTPERTAGGLAVLSPIVPIIIVLGFKLYQVITKNPGYDFPLNTALLAGILYCLATTGAGPKGRIQRLTKAIFDSITSVAPVLALIIGIGMVIRVTWDPVVGTYMEPLLKHVIPGKQVLYVLVFTVLAPLALYRGPLNVWGMGIAIGGIIIQTGVLPPLAVVAALYSVGMIQGVSDPTNTHNVWIAGFLGEDVQVFTKKTLPFTWGMAALGLVISAVMFVKG